MTRLFDIVFSGIALILMSPLFLPIIIALRLTGEGEIFYKQVRIGRGGESFNLLKFATMLKDSPRIGAGTITLADDPRVLPLGRFLRKSKINELPQLVNILVGQMSVIGPRPLTMDQFKNYSAEGRELIFRNRPGLSGLGSIVFRDEESLLGASDQPKRFYQTVIAPYKEELELWYHDRRRLSDYFILIFLTAWVVVFPRSKLLWRIFASVPKPNEKLDQAMAKGL